MRLSKTFLIITSLFSLVACQNPDISSYARLTTPKVEKITTTNSNSMSQKTYDSYVSFARKFSSLMMEYNNKEDEQSLGISIPDAYLCLAIMGITSKESACNDVLNFLDLSNILELRVAVKEILNCFATLYKNNNGKLVGGYNLNSLWLNPEIVSLIKEKDEVLYKDLEEIFDVSIFMEALTSKKANDYLKVCGLKEMPTPKIELDDENPSALNAMSVYYCLDYFDELEKQIYKNQYQSGNHKMDYFLNNSSSKVDYIQSRADRVVYENENFYGSSLNINYLNLAFFLPKDKDALPSSIFHDVINENYSLKDGVFRDYSGEEHKTNTFEVNICAPYFSLDNKCELDHDALTKVLPIITKSGASERLVKANIGSLFLDYIKQFSVMKFNYDGFYSCSVTIGGAEATSVGNQYEPFDLILDHPYVFEVRKTVRIDNNHKVAPLIIGEIVNPNYKE
ncbi:MAG: hypothetical protein J6X03_01400 [Bacilli bacterium]|nr:hypothetical protein [Bacilli bacterium]